MAGERAARDVVEHLSPRSARVRVGWSAGLPPDAARARPGGARPRLTPAAQTTSVLLLPTRVAGARGRAPRGRRRRSRRSRRSGAGCGCASGRLPRTAPRRAARSSQVGGGRAAPVVRRGDTRLVTVGRGSCARRSRSASSPARRLVRPAQARGPARCSVGGATRGGRATCPASARSSARSSGRAPLRAAGGPSWRLDALRRRIGRRAHALERERRRASRLQAPHGRAARRAGPRARTARRRVLLVGGAARRAAGGASRCWPPARWGATSPPSARGWSGAARGRWQLALLTGAEAAWPAAAGWRRRRASRWRSPRCARRAAGVEAGAAAGPHAAERPRRSPPRSPAGRWRPRCSALGSRRWRPAAGAPRTRWRSAPPARWRRAGPRRGERGPAGRRGDPLPVLLPALACLAAGLVVAARGVRPRCAGRSPRRAPGPLACALAALGLARAPGAAGAHLAFVAVACGLALLRGGLRGHAAPRRARPGRLPGAARRDGARGAGLRAAAAARAAGPLAGARRRRPALPVERRRPPCRAGRPGSRCRCSALPAAGLRGAARLARRRGLGAARRARAALGAARPVAAARAGRAAGARTLTRRARATEATALDLTAHVLARRRLVASRPARHDRAADALAGAALPAAAAGGRLVGAEAVPRSGPAGDRRATGWPRARPAPDVVSGTPASSARPDAGGRPSAARRLGRARLARAPAAPRRDDLRALRLRPRRAPRCCARASPPTAARSPSSPTRPPPGARRRGGRLPLSVDGRRCARGWSATWSGSPPWARTRTAFARRRRGTLAPRSADAPGAGPPDELWLSVAPARRGAAARGAAPPRRCARCR